MLSERLLFAASAPTPRTHVVCVPCAPVCSGRLEGTVKKFEQQSETVKGNIAALQKGNAQQ